MSYPGSSRHSSYNNRFRTSSSGDGDGDNNGVHIKDIRIIHDIHNDLTTATTSTTTPAAAAAVFKEQNRLASVTEGVDMFGHTLTFGSPSSSSSPFSPSPPPVQSPPPADHSNARFLRMTSREPLHDVFGHGRGGGDLPSSPGAEAGLMGVNPLSGRYYGGGGGGATSTGVVPIGVTPFVDSGLVMPLAHSGEAMAVGTPPRLSQSGGGGGRGGGSEGGGGATGVALPFSRQSSASGEPSRPQAPGQPRRLSRGASVTADSRRQQFAAAGHVVTSADSGCDEVFVEMNGGGGTGTGTGGGARKGMQHQYSLPDTSLFPDKRRAHVTFSTSSTASILPNPYNRLNHRLHSVVWCCSCLYFVFFCCLPAIHYMEQSDVEFQRDNHKRARQLGRASTFFFFTGSLIALTLMALVFFLAIFFAVY